MDKIDQLIQEGQAYTFRNNSYSVSHGTYTRASEDFLSWVATIEDFIRTNYGEESAAFKLYQTFDRRKLSGFEQTDFDEQKAKLSGALKSCKTITPLTKKKQEDDHNVIRLIKNPIFWTVIVVVTGASFALGLNFGSSKFDREKNEYYQQTIKLTDELNKSRDAINSKDSIIKALRHNQPAVKDSSNKASD